MSCIISRRLWEPHRGVESHNMDASIFTLREMAVQSLASRSRTNGRQDGQNRGFIAECHAGRALKVAKVCMPCIRG
jgi:hypothetical protein